MKMKRWLETSILIKFGSGFGRAYTRHQCRKTIVLSCHIYLINSGAEKMNDI